MNPWLKSARPKTLPLSISTILIGASLSNFYKPIDWFLFGLLIVIAVSLQILSNFANDYGDFQKGTDQKAQRHDRMLTSGAISAEQMKRVLWVLSVFVLFVGSYTVWYGLIKTKSSNLVYFWSAFHIWSTRHCRSDFIHGWVKKLTVTTG
jgi:1,4-dihydroxy-2-naphthoate octaprenyltransferase